MKNLSGTDKSRLNYLDMAKGIGIIFVIICHTGFVGEPIRRFFGSFHMPLFFAVSGILLFVKRESERPLKEIVLKKLRTIMLPYLCFSVLDIVIYAVCSLIYGQEGIFSNVLLAVRKTITFYGHSVLWFLPAFFIAEIVFIALLKRLSLWSFVAVPAIAALAFLLHKELLSAGGAYGDSFLFAVFSDFLIALIRAMICLVFVAAGYALAYMMKNIFKSDTGNDNPVIGALTGIALLVATFFISRKNGNTDLNLCVFSNVFLYYPAAVSGSFGLILICKAMEKISNKGIFRPIIYFGINSLIVMVTHLDFYLLYFAESISLRIVTYVSRGKVYVLNFLVLAFVLMAEAVLIEIINRFFPVLIGKRRRHN